MFRASTCREPQALINEKGKIVGLSYSRRRIHNAAERKAGASAAPRPAVQAKRHTHFLDSPVPLSRLPAFPPAKSSLRLHYRQFSLAFVRDRTLTFRGRFLVQDGARQVLDGRKFMPDNLHLSKDGLDAWADCAEATVHSGLKDG